MRCCTCTAGDVMNCTVSLKSRPQPHLDATRPEDGCDRRLGRELGQGLVVNL